MDYRYGIIVHGRFRRVFASLVHAQPAVSITAHFADLRDLRLERTKAHDLATILVIAICASIAGANDWVAVAEFGRSKQAWSATFLDLPHGIPSHDTFWRVFRALDPRSVPMLLPELDPGNEPLDRGTSDRLPGRQPQHQRQLQARHAAHDRFLRRVREKVELIESRTDKR